jgi:hypothetical protein
MFQHPTAAHMAKQGSGRWSIFRRSFHLVALLPCRVEGGVSDLPDVARMVHNTPNCITPGAIKTESEAKVVTDERLAP